MSFIKRNHQAEYTHFVRQYTLIKAHFPEFVCSINRGQLTCRAKIMPGQECTTYSILLNYKRGGSPRVKITKPKILQEQWSQVHIYKHSGELCLYDCRLGGQPWQWHYNLHETIIPWTAEWLVYYEYYLLTGKWAGPEADHGVLPKKTP